MVSTPTCPRIADFSGLTHPSASGLVNKLQQIDDDLHASLHGAGLLSLGARYSMPVARFGPGRCAASSNGRQIPIPGYSIIGHMMNFTATAICSIPPV